MSRHSIAGRSTVVGTTLRAIASIFATATINGNLREVGVFNTTTTAVCVGLVRFTNATGVGAALTEGDYDPGKIALVTGFAGHTGDGATAAGPFRQASLGAAIGSGVIWTFGESGIMIPIGTANGIGVICPVGTGQLLDYYFDWDE